ncbi:MAG: hypothetical protein DMG49_25145 [Acidobacteria bacterium]|nr:MAG: hypothetical protein DMG49_25145 [Acidobacteriota bacterium]
MTELRWIPQARKFAWRGRTAVIVMRREFGGSGGGYGRLRPLMPEFRKLHSPERNHRSVIPKQ